IVASETDAALTPPARGRNGEFHGRIRVWHEGPARKAETRLSGKGHPGRLHFACLARRRGTSRYARGRNHQLDLASRRSALAQGREGRQSRLIIKAAPVLRAPLSISGRDKAQAMLRDIAEARHRDRPTASAPRPRYASPGESPQDYQTWQAESRACRHRSAQP